MESSKIGCTFVETLKLNYMSKTILSVENGLKIQADQILRWKYILKPEAYDKLFDHFREVNVSSKYKSGYDVPRGNDIDVWVANNLMPARTKSREYLEMLEREFTVELCRTGYGFTTVQIKAKTQEEANQIALDHSGDYDYNEKTAEYTIV